jgi:hypothetical protein
VKKGRILKGNLPKQWAFSAINLDTFPFSPLFFVPLHLKIGHMTLRELIYSVDSEQYSDNMLYQKLRDIKPEYGSSKHIQVKVVDGDIAITNLHVGSLGDIVAYPIDIDPDLNISKIQLMDAILKELSSDGFTESEASDFWSDFDNLQKAKIIR